MLIHIALVTVVVLTTQQAVAIEGVRGTVVQDVIRDTLVLVVDLEVSIRVGIVAICSVFEVGDPLAVTHLADRNVGLRVFCSCSLGIGARQD